MKLMIIGVTLAGFAAFTPLSAQRPSGNQGGSTQNCTQSSGSVSDVILGRSSPSTVGCVDNRSNRRASSRTSAQVNGGGWYQVGNAGNGGTIYERQTRDQYGNLIIQRARRDRNGNMSIISTRNVGNNGTYNNGGYNNGTYNNTRRSGDGDDHGNYQNGSRHDNGNHNGQYKNGNGHGKDKNKDNKHGDD